MRRNPAALPPPKCAPARYLPRLHTGTKIPKTADIPPPLQDAPASAAGEGWGGGSDHHTATAIKSPTDAEQPFTEHAGHKPPTCKRRQPVAIPFTYTLSAQVYVKPAIGCALAHRLPPKTTTAARIPANLLPSPCGEGLGVGLACIPPMPNHPPTQNNHSANTPGINPRPASGADL